MDNESVQITMYSTQHDISEETTKTTYSGNCRVLAGKHAITYEEYFEGDHGSPVKNKNLIKISDNAVHLTKKGPVTTQMYFEQGKKYYGNYQTPFGSFTMEIYTEQLQIQKEEYGVSASIVYQLSLNQCAVSRCTIQIEIKQFQ